jgi:hypothetical protein
MTGINNRARAKTPRVPRNCGVFEKNLAIPTFALVGTITGAESLTAVFGIGTGVSFPVGSCVEVPAELRLGVGLEKSTKVFGVFRFLVIASPVPRRDDVMGVDSSKTPMTWHLVCMLGAIVLIVGSMLYPFLPGLYDSSAVTLSIMSQLFAMAGLLHVPLGAFWLVYELQHRKTKARGSPGKDWGRRFAWASLGAATIVALVVALGASVDAHYALGIAVLGLWACCLVRFVAGLRVSSGGTDRPFPVAPLYLIILPLAAATVRFTLIGPAAEFSRNKAIDESGRLIDDIERYHVVHGRYPRSLQSLWDDYRPAVIGIERYHYEPHGDYYNVYFKHFAVALDTKEIVMFNPRDEQEFTSHNADLFQLSAENLARMRGHYSVRDTERPHWKYFLFD